MIRTTTNTKNVTLKPDKVKTLIENCLYGGRDGETGVCEVAWVILQKLGEEAGLEFVAEKGTQSAFECIDGRYYMPNKQMMLRREHKIKQRDNPPLK